MAGYLIIAGVGLAVLVAALVVGELLDGVLEPLNAVLGGDVLSTGAIAGFLAAFGGAAALFTPSLGTGLAGAVGLVAGVLVGAGTGWFTRQLARGTTDTTPNAASLTGSRGTVITPVPSDGYGEVALVVAGHPTKVNARSFEPLAAGTRVTVVSVLSPTSVTVVRLD
jgi:membrane protein implicated in regulation of membrane protease activity